MEKKIILSGFIVLLMIDMACALQVTTMYQPLDFTECTYECYCPYGDCFHSPEIQKTTWKTHCWMYWSQITFPEDFKLVTEDNSVVGDELCVGDKFTVQNNIKSGPNGAFYDGDGGEYWEESGFVDSPPVLWVNDITAVAKELVGCPNSKSSGFNGPMYSSDTSMDSAATGLCSSGVSAGDISDAFDLDLKEAIAAGNSSYDSSLADCNFEDSECKKGGDPSDSNLGLPTSESKIVSLNGGVACAVADRGANYSGLVKKGNYYEVVGSGNITFSASIELQCMYYYEKKDFKNKNTPNPSAKYGVGYPISFGCGLGESEGLEADMLEKSYCGKSSMQNLCNRMSAGYFKVSEINLTKNIRVVDAGTQNVGLSVVGADDIKFDQENILKVLVKNGGDVDITVAGISSKVPYRFISCDKAPVKPGEEAECLLSVTPKIGSGLDVVVSYGCKVCGKVKAGSVSKVLIESTSVAPAASAQVYSIDVHGGCENQYYGCYAPDNDGKFAAGYKCYNTGDQYYSPVRERFDLRFDLPDLTSKTVVGASLNLFASGVNRAQEVRVFSGKVDWTPTSCSASGDICTRPYCEECAPSFDFAGGVEQSAQKIQGNAITFDLSDLVKKAYVEGAKSLSLQLRGEEDVWNSGGKDSCAGMNAWTKQDIEIYGKGPNQPYLEIVYK